MGSDKPLSIVIASFYFALSGVLGAVAAIYAFIAAPGFPGFAFMFATTFAFAVADAVCCYGLWTRQGWARATAITVIVATMAHGAIQNALVPDPQWSLYVVNLLVSLAVLVVIDTEEARRHFGLRDRPAPLGGVPIPGRFDFRVRLMERNAE